MSLIEDELIRSQQYCCLSFLDPPSMAQLHNERCMHSFVNKELANQPSIKTEVTRDDLVADYRVYNSVHFNKLVSTLPEKFRAHTHVRGIKIRGVDATMVEAQARVAKLSKIQTEEPVHIFIAENGKWVPFMSKNLPEGANEKMNRMMYDYITDAKKASIAFNDRLQEARKMSIKADADEPETDSVPKEVVLEEFNPEKDYLTEDTVDADQRFFCVSFVEPLPEVTEYLMDRCTKSFLYSYLFGQFQDHFTLNKIDKVNQPEYPETIDTLFQKFTDYKNTQEVPEDTKENVPCFKLRGCFANLQDAESQSKHLQTIDGSVDVLVGHVGFWLPFAAVNKDDIKSVYNETGLNEIHTTLDEHRNKIEANKEQMRKMNFDPDNTVYGQKKILSEESGLMDRMQEPVHPSERPAQPAPVEIVEL